jgi:O-antigen ligase
VTTILLGTCGLAAFAAVCAWFRSLLAADRGAVLAVVLLSAILVESVLYNPIDVPRGLFHLYAGGVQVRTVDLVLLAAVLARLTLPRRSAGSLTAAWLAFAAWLVLEAYLGLRNGNPSANVQFELKALLYLALGWAVAGAAPTARDLQILTRFCTVAAGAAGILLATSLARVFVTFGGVLKGAGLGVLSSSCATVFPMVGILALSLFLCLKPARYDLLAAAIVLCATVLAPGQRASLLELGISVLVLLAASPFGRRHLRVTLTQLALGVAAVVLVAGSAWVVRAATTSQASLPFAKAVGSALHSHQKSLSAQDRVNQLEVARSLIPDHPILGYGLGRTIVYFEAGSKQFVVSYLSHNILTDLLLRTGAIGLVLFLVAFWLTLNDSLKRWRDPGRSPVEGALALCALAVLVGWFAHGMVESLFEQVRVTPFAFALYGLARSGVGERSAVEERARTHAARALVVRESG